MKRLLSAANRHLLRRDLPHGLISWRYLLPHQPAAVRIHRRLWLMARPPRLPLPLYLVMELMLWSRWVTWSGWWNCWRLVRRLGAEKTLQEGNGRSGLLLRLLIMSLGHCVPPGELVAFGLSQQGGRQQLWSYVYRHETGAFHRWRNASIGENGPALTLVQDKLGLADLLARHNLPVAPALATIPCGAIFDPAIHLQSSPRLFCKPRHGSASRDNFVIERRHEGAPPAIFAVHNGMKAQPSTLDAVNQALKRDDFLVQALMVNHPLLAPLAPAYDAVTVRIITEQQSPHGAKCYCSVLEIPAREENGDRYHTILPIDPFSGQIRSLPGKRLPARVQARHDAAVARMKGVPIPFWDRIMASATAAHQLVPGLYAIAWDYVITPDGPLMLEGNSGWGMSTPQLLHGGLLKQILRED